MPKKLSKKAVRRLTSLFITTSIVTGSFVPTAIVLAEEKKSYTKEVEAIDEIANSEVNEEETSGVEEFTPDVEVVENPGELDTERTAEEVQLNGQLDAPLGVDKSEPLTGFGLDPLVSSEEGPQSETVLNSYVSNSTAFIFLDSTRTLKGEVAKLLDMSFHTVEITMHSNMSNTDATELSKLNAVAPNIKKLSIQFEANVTNKSIGDGLQVRWCEEVSSNAITIGNNAFGNAFGDAGVNTKTSPLKEVNLPNVTTFGDMAFFECTSLEKVSLPNVTTFGEGAFYRCRSLEKVSLPNVTTFGGNALSGLMSLEKVSLPNVTTFGKNAFGGIGASEVDLPKVTSFGENAFFGTGLKSLSLPNVISMGYGSISQNSQLKEISLPKFEFFTHNIDSTRAFDYNASLEKVSMPNFQGSLKVLGFDIAFDDTPPSPLKELTIGSTDVGVMGTTPRSTITTLNLTATGMLESGLSSSFPNLKHLTSNATTAGNDTLLQANALETVTMPNVTSFGDNAFRLTPALKEVKLPSTTVFGDSAFRNSTGPEALDLPQAKTFGPNSFTSANIGSIGLPSAEEIGAFSFTNATIGVIDIPKAIKISDIRSNDIGFVKFNKEISSAVSDLPNSPNTIGIIQGASPEKHETSDGSFTLTRGDYITNTSKLEKSSWGAELTNEITTLYSVGDLSFKNISGDDSGEYNVSLWNENSENLGRISTDWNTLTLENSVEVSDFQFEFHGEEGNSTATLIGYTGSDVEVEIPNEVVNTNTGWTEPSVVTAIKSSVFRNKGLVSVVLPKGLTSIGNYVFQNNQLTSVTLPEGLTSIGTSAFRNNQLTSVTIPKGVTSIDNYTFMDNQLTSVTLPEGLTTIGTSTFENNQLTSVTLPEGLTTIGTSAFSNNQLTSVTIPKGVTSITNYAFENNQLTSVTLPEGLTTIGNYAFENNQLTSVTLPEGLTTIGNYAFRNNQLTSVTIPKGVTSITNYAFENNQLTSVTLPEGVTSIGRAAFLNNQLTSVTLPEGLTSISDYTFTNNQLTSVTLPEGVTSIGNSAFYRNQLTSVTLPEGLTSISDSAFRDNQLTSVTLPEGVTSIGNYVFKDNPLKKIEFMSNKVPTLGLVLFNANAQLETIIAPETSLTEYKGALTSGMFSLAESQTILLRSENNQVTYTDETQEVYTVIEGEDVTFGVDVSDAEMYRMTPTNKVWELEEPAFQWMKDGSPLGDQVNSSLSFTPTTVSDSGTYYVSVTHPALDQTQLSDIQLTVNATVVAGAPVTEQHVDENDQHLRQPRILRGNIGEKYTTCPGMFDGYRLKSTPDNASGTFTSDAQTVTYRYETLATPDAPHVNAVNDKDTMITGTGVVGATIKVMSEAQTLAVGQVETDGTYALPIVQQAAGTVLSVTQTLDGMESPSTSITVSKTEEVYTTKNEFKLGYWQSYGLILEGQLTNESWDVSSHEGLQGTVQLVNENGTVECSSPMMMTNWYDETQYNGYQAILDESMAATLSSGVYEIRMVVSQNGNELANEAIGLPMMSRQMGLLMNFTSNFMSLPSNHIGSSFLEMKSKNQRAHIQIDTQEDTPIMGLISEAIIEEGRAINGFILNAPFDFSQEHQKNLIIETKTGEEVAVIEEVHTWDLSNWGLGVSHLDVHSGFQIIIPNDYTNTSLYQYKITITAPGELETEHMRIALDKII